MDLADALAEFDRVALNLDKLDRVWARMCAMVPTGPFIAAGDPDDVVYAELGEAWTEIARSLPAITGWRLEAEIIPYAAIGQTRLDYLEIGEPEGLWSLDAAVAAPGSEALRYRHRLANARQALVRARGEELVARIDELLAPIPEDPSQDLSELAAHPVVDELRERLAELERLLGDALEGGPRQYDMHRHLHFGEPHDLRDIATLDWPAFRPHVELALYDDEHPVPVTLGDLGDALGIASSPVSAGIKWDRLDPDGFERLLARLMEASGDYTRINRLMNVNAPDGGRDIEAYRRVTNGMLGERYERVFAQAKHWPKRGVGTSELSELVHAKVPLWEGEPVQELLVATTGSFTQDAVRWAEAHNREAKRPRIELLSDHELEALLRRLPAVVAEFGVI